MSEYLLNLGGEVDTVDTETRARKKAVAIDSFVTKPDAAEYFKTVNGQPDIATPISDYVRQLGQEQEQIATMVNDTLTPEERIAQLRLNIQSAGSEDVVNTNNEIDAGLATNALSLIVPPSQIRQEKANNLLNLSTEL